MGPTSTSITGAIPTGNIPAPAGSDAFRKAFQQELLARYPDHVRRLTWSREQILDHQRAGLRELLAYAIEHSPFHARRLRGVDPDQVDPQDLSALPVMSKAEMMASLDQVYTDPALRRAEVEAVLARTGREPVPILGRYVALVSGGSSGVRGVFTFDLAALVEFIATITRGLMARIMAGGGSPPGGLLLAMVGAPCAVHATGLAEPLTAGGGMPFYWKSASVTASIGELVARLNEMRPAMLFGYPTVLAQLASEQRAGRLRISPVGVLSTSEMCTPDLRIAIHDGFGAQVINTFASTEGLVGATVPDGDVHAFADDACIVELVDADNRPVAPGAPSAKVLLTNLYNKVQPLIRYELTDSLRQQPAATEHGHLRAIVDGRADDVFRYDRIQLHPHVIRSVLVRHPQITEHQVVQTADGIHASVVATEPGAAVDLPALTSHLTAALTEAGLPAPAVAADQIPQLSRDPGTGKLRRFIPLP
jgi:phenylacetate-coenzyme A ligase PaaK-like adenylate-forming protein